MLLIRLGCFHLDNPIYIIIVQNQQVLYGTEKSMYYLSLCFVTRSVSLPHWVFGGAVVIMRSVDRQVVVQIHANAEMPAPRMVKFILSRDVTNPFGLFRRKCQVFWTKPCRLHTNEVSTSKVSLILNVIISVVHLHLLSLSRFPSPSSLSPSSSSHSRYPPSLPPAPKSEDINYSTKFWPRKGFLSKCGS